MFRVGQKEIERVAKAMYDSHQFKKPWDHPDTVRIHRPHTLRTATVAIAEMKRIIASKATQRERA